MLSSAYIFFKGIIRYAFGKDIAGSQCTFPPLFYESSLTAAPIATPGRRRNYMLHDFTKYLKKPPQSGGFNIIYDWPGNFFKPMLF